MSTIRSSTWFVDRRRELWECVSYIAKGARFMVLAVLATSTATTVSTGELEGLLGVVVGGALLAGLIIILARHAVSSPKPEPAGSVVRSWIAVSLVPLLLAFGAATFSIVARNLAGSVPSPDVTMSAHS
jgi:hypothetical protein